MNFEALSFIGGIIISLITLIVKDALMKNTFKHEITAMQERLKAEDIINKAQESEIRMLQNTIVELKTNMLNLRERFDDFYHMQKEEVKSIQHTLNETNQRFASLDSTLKGLTKWLERVENKLEDK